MAFSGVALRGNGTHTSSAAFNNVLPSAAIPVGRLLIAVCTSDNRATTDGPSTHHLVTDDKGNTWIKVFEETETDGAAADGATESLWFTVVTTQIETTDDVLNTYQGGNNDAGVITLVVATIGAGSGIAFEGPDIDHVAASANATSTLSGLPNREYLFVGAFGAEGNDNTKTPIANYTEITDGRSGTNSGTDVCTHVGTRILTGTGDTWTSSGVTYTSGIQSLTAFYEVPTVTGALASTLASTTADLNGTVANPVTGALASTLASTAAAFAGVEAMQGTLASTLASTAADFNGTVAAPVTGALASTLADTTADLTGAEAMQGALASTLQDVDGALDGTVTAAAITGALAATLDPTTAALVGTESMEGALAASLGDQVAALAGTVANPVTGSLAADLDDVVGDLVGAEGFAGSLASTLADTTADLAGTVANPVTGSLAADAEDTTADFTGTVTPPAVTGALAATLDPTDGAFVGQSVEGAAGALASILEGAQGSFTGTVTPPAVTGALASVLTDASAALTGAVSAASVTGTLAAQLLPHTMAAAGVVVNPGPPLVEPLGVSLSEVGPHGVLVVLDPEGRLDEHVAGVVLTDPGASGKLT